LLDVGGLAALAALAVACLHLGELEPLLYRGGLASVALATTVVIMACTHPYTRLGASLLGWRPLRWIGIRSYGIYLWHWPVFMVSRPQLDVSLEGLPLVVLRLAITVVVAELSYRYVERPIRKGALGRVWGTLGEAGRFRRRRLSVLWAGAAVPVVVLCAALGLAVARAQPPEPPSYISAKEIHSKGPPDTSGAASNTETTSSHARGPVTAAKANAGVSAAKPETAAEGSAAGTRDQEARASEEPAAAKDKKAPTGAAAGAPVGTVSAVGDSVMLGAANQLYKDIDNLTVMDAEVGLQASAAIDILRWRRASGQLGDVVIVHIGNNGTFTARQFDEMMRVLAGVRRVVFVNVKVPRVWEQPNNKVIAEGVRRYPNAVLVDWYAASVNHPEFFVEDGVHLQIKGQRVYAGLISDRLQASRGRQ
jgi:hypothetical protein